MSGKILGTPVTVISEVIADRVDIISYRVSVTGLGASVDIEYTQGSTNGDGSITVVGTKVKSISGADLVAAMADATGNVTGPLLNTAVGAGLITPENAAALVALVKSQPALLAQAYYNATRDALYTLIP